MRNTSRSYPVFGAVALALLLFTSPTASAQEKNSDETQQRVAEFKSVNKYALIVGINEYSGEDIPPLRFAVNDAEALYRVLTDSLRGAFPPESVVLLTDTSDRKPTRLNIGKSLRRIRVYAQEEDLVLIFFSGHGYEEGGRAYLLPRDADLEALDFTALERDAFVRQIDGIVARKVIVVLDACHAGGISRGGKGAGEDAALSEMYYNRFAASQGRAFIASCSGGQLSWEDEEAGHGVFTGSLIRGLSGEADRFPKDGLVTLYEVRRFLEEDVSNWAKRHGRIQQPQVSLESAYGDIPVALNTDYLQVQARETEQRRREAEELKMGLVGMVGLTSSELVDALELLDRYAEGGELTPDEKQTIGFIRNLVEGSIDVDMYRAGVRGLSVDVDVSEVVLPQAPSPRYSLIGLGITGALGLASWALNSSADDKYDQWNQCRLETQLPCDDLGDAYDDKLRQAQVVAGAAVVVAVVTGYFGYRYYNARKDYQSDMERLLSSMSVELNRNGHWFTWVRRF